MSNATHFLKKNMPVRLVANPIVMVWKNMTTLRWRNWWGKEICTASIPRSSSQTYKAVCVCVCVHNQLSLTTSHSTTKTPFWNSTTATVKCHLPHRKDGLKVPSRGCQMGNFQYFWPQGSHRLITYSSRGHSGAVFFPWCLKLQSCITKYVQKHSGQGCSWSEFHSLTPHLDALS